MSRKIETLITVTIFLFLALVLGHKAYILMTEPDPVVWYHGSERVEHDQYYGGMVNGNVSYGAYCTSAVEDLLHTGLGSVYITGRYGSADFCRYTSEFFLGIAITGLGNKEESLDWPVDNALTISHGGDGNPAAYGDGVDYHITAENLSEAMPLMANIVLEINAATSSPLSTEQMRTLLNDTSDGWKESDGKRYGRIINVERAIDYLVNGYPAISCTDCGWMTPAIDHLLLLEEAK